jgi:hypothetical protein
MRQLRAAATTDVAGAGALDGQQPIPWPASEQAAADPKALKAQLRARLARGRMQ